MAKKKSKSALDSIIELLIYSGLFYILYNWITAANEKEDRAVPGISGPPGIPKKEEFHRRMIPIKDINGVDLIVRDLKKLSNDEVGEVIRLMKDGRESLLLQLPLYKHFQNTKVTGELRKGQWRIFTYKFNENDHFILSFFKKKQNEKNPAELKRAEARLKEYLEHYRT